MNAQWGKKKVTFFFCYRQEEFKKAKQSWRKSKLDSITNSCEYSYSEDKSKYCLQLITRIHSLSRFKNHIINMWSSINHSSYMITWTTQDSISSKLKLKQKVKIKTHNILENLETPIKNRDSQNSGDSDNTCTRFMRQAGQQNFIP